MHGEHAIGMARITSDDIKYKLEEIDNIIGKKYSLEHPQKEMNWRTCMPRRIYG